MDITPQELVEGTIELVSLPEVVARLNDALQDPRTSTAQIAQLIGEDPGLATRLLKLANSPFYGFPSRIDTLSRATAIIGTEELRDLVVATAVTRAFAGLHNDIINMELFWRHSLYCAVFARVLAEQRQERNIERLFVAGLLHDIGALILFAKLPELAHAALVQVCPGGKPVFEAEEILMGFHHGTVGATLMRVWRLPKNLQEAAEFHHTPQAAREFTSDVAIIHLAEMLTNAHMGGYRELNAPVITEAEAWLRAGLSQETMETVQTNAQAQFEAAYQLLFA